MKSSMLSMLWGTYKIEKVSKCPNHRFLCVNSRFKFSMLMSRFGVQDETVGFSTGTEEHLTETKVDKLKEILILPLLDAEFRYTMGDRRVPTE